MRGLVFLALWLVTAAFAEPEKWTGEDKVLHLAAGTFISGAVTVWTEKPMWGFAAGCGFGVIKEAADRSSTGFSTKDAIVTCLGAGIGVYGGYLLINRSGGATRVSYTREF